MLETLLPSPILGCRQGPRVDVHSNLGTPYMRVVCQDRLKTDTEVGWRQSWVSSERGEVRTAR